MRTYLPTLGTRTAIASRAEPKGVERGPARPRPVQANRLLDTAQPARGPVHQFASLPPDRSSDRAATPNRTGLPDRLKAGIERLSGFAMDDVRVHYNSAKPATVQALAYTKGAEIHVGPGQERHLPHEAWHVVQQKQGRVKPALQMKGALINDDPDLETEADQVEEKSNFGSSGALKLKSKVDLSHFETIQAKLVKDKFNVAGENHVVSGTKKRRPAEEKFTKEIVGGFYLKENELHEDANKTSYKLLSFFGFGKDTQERPDPWHLRLAHTLLKATYAAEQNRAEMLKWIKRLIGEAEWLDERTSPFSEQTKANIKSFVQTTTPQLAGLEKDTDAGAYDTEIMKSAALSVVNFKAANLKELVGGAVDIDEKASDADTQENINKARSQKMYEAAESHGKKGSVGVWKIGETHAEDLEAAGPKNFALTRMAAFDLEFLQWEAKNKTP